MSEGPFNFEHPPIPGRFTTQTQVGSPFSNPLYHNLYRMAGQSIYRGLGGTGQPSYMPQRVQGGIPMDLYYQATGGNAMQQHFMNQFFRQNNPIAGQLSQLLRNNPQHSQFVNQFGSSAPGQMLSQMAMQSNPAQMVMQGNLVAGVQHMVGTSGAFMPSMPAANLNDMRIQHTMGLNRAMGVAQGITNEIYRNPATGQLGTVANNNYLKGFRSEAAFQIASLSAARGTLSRDNAMATRQVGSTLGALSAGRNVFGDIGAAQMMSQIEDFTGGDITSVRGSSAAMSKLNKIAALAQSVGVQAKQLVDVKKSIDNALFDPSTGAGLMGDMSTLAVGANGRPLGGYTDIVSTGITKDVAAMSSRYGVRDPRGIRHLTQQRMVVERRRQGSSAYRTMNVLEAMRASGQLTDVEEAQLTGIMEKGDVGALSRFSADVSEARFGSADAINKMIRNDKVFSSFMQANTAGLGDRAREQMSHRLRQGATLLEGREAQTRFTQMSAAGMRKKARAIARMSGARLDTGEFSEQGIQGMLSTIAGSKLSGDTKGLLAGEITRMQEQGMSFDEIASAMKDDVLFQESGIGYEHLIASGQQAQGRAMLKQVGTGGSAAAAFSRSIMGQVKDRKDPAFKQYREQLRAAQKSGDVSKIDQLNQKFLDENGARLGMDMNAMKKRKAILDKKMHNMSVNRIPRQQGQTIAGKGIQSQFIDPNQLYNFAGFNELYAQGMMQQTFADKGADGLTAGQRTNVAARSLTPYAQASADMMAKQPSAAQGLWNFAMTGDTGMLMGAFGLQAPGGPTGRAVQKTGRGEGTVGPTNANISSGQPLKVVIVGSEIGGNSGSYDPNPGESARSGNSIGAGARR